MSERVLKIRESELREMTGDAVEEAMAIGRAQGVDLARSIVQRCHDKAQERGWKLDYAPLVEVLSDAFNELNRSKANAPTKTT